jgi:GAF domain-containing protein
MVLNAINETADIFLSHEHEAFGDALGRGINLIASVTSIDRVAVYRLTGNNRRMEQIYLWEHGNTVDSEKEQTELPDVPPVIRWLEVLKKGECIHNRVGDVPKDQADFLSLFGIKTILFVPIFTQNILWGVITLANLNDDKYFDEDFVDLMHLAARMCASAVVRHVMEREVAEKDELIRTMIENAPDGLIFFDENLK